MAVEKAAKPAHPKAEALAPPLAANTPPVKHPAAAPLYRSFLARYYFPRYHPQKSIKVSKKKHPHSRLTIASDQRKKKKKQAPI